jgi:hypothetical protein
MEPKSGDRVSLDAKKVGQSRRAGVVRSVTQGISGIRYEISWDDGSVSVIAPGAGILLVERGRSARSSSSKRSKPKAKASKSKAPKAQKAKPNAKQKAKQKAKKSRSKAKTGKRK